MATTEIQNKIEEILDKVAIALIQSPTSCYGSKETVQLNQKTIRDGIVSLGKSSEEKLIVYQKDIKANPADLISEINQDDGTTTTLENIATNILPDTGVTGFIININPSTCAIDLITTPASSLYGGDNGGLDITNLLQGTNEETGQVNPVNLGQFIGYDKKSENIDVGQANEFLDTNIFELIGDGASRQARINTFFTEFENLTQSPPVFVDEDADGLIDMATTYDTTNNITDNTEYDETKSIVRLISNEQENNENQSLEYLRNRLDDYLEDVDDVPGPPADSRPEYKNQSNGYLKFRNLNQGIIIRNVNNEYIEGLNPETQDYLSTGFTITMWVRFLDKKSEGTLFNFGNPTRETNPLGFKLETLVNEEQRYLRLLVYDGFGDDGTNPYSGVGHWYDSHVGINDTPKVLSELSTIGGLESVDITQYTTVPVNLTEWYFICATYNPLVNEQASQINILDPDYWRNNMVDNGTGTPSGQYTYNSGFGNRSKVEIISRTQLLTARGYKL